MEMIRFIFAAVFLISGVVTMIVAVFGLFRFKFVLNRMHTAATSDTFGLLLSMIGLIIWKGFGFEALKMMISLPRAESLRQASRASSQAETLIMRS